MRALLSLLLSFSILFSSVSPSLAQVGKGARSVRNGLKAARSVRVRTPAVPRTPSVSSSQVTQTVRAQRPASVKRILSSFKRGNYAGLSSQILRLPAAERPLLLRNEFVNLALNGHVAAPELAEAVSFYRQDLSQAANGFAKTAGLDLNTFLSSAKDVYSADFTTLTFCRFALADAGSLALFGSKADASALTGFYKTAVGTPFQPVAAVITARGLLRYGAYEEFSAWAKENASNDYFWGELSAYVKEQGLPVELDIPAAETEAVSAGLRSVLTKGPEANLLHADFSRAATAKWMALEAKPAAPAPAAQPAAQAAPAPALASPALHVDVAAADLNLSPVEIAAPRQTAAAAPAADAAPVQTPAVSSGANKALTPARASSNSGILYSGLPVFEMAAAMQKGYRKVVDWFRGKKTSRNALAEEPGLHENRVAPVYEARRVSPASLGAEDWAPVPTEDIAAEVAEDGFKFTLENEDGVESILDNVDISIDASIKTKGYNRVVLAQDHVFELRNLELAPGEIDHFYVEMPNSSGELVRLGQGAAGLDMPRHLRVKLEKVPNRRYQVRTLDLYHEGSSVPYMSADVDASLLPSGKGHLLADKEGNVWFVSEEKGERVLLKDYYIRLPKEDSKYWAKIMQKDGNAFALQFHSTLDKTGVIATSIPALQIGWGKIGGRVLNEYTDFSESASSSLMFGINNVLPSLVGFVHPLLKRYGEARVSRWGVGLLLGGGATALGSGLYGVLDGHMSPLQTAGFLGAVTLTAIGTSVTRYVQNILISANRGKVMSRGGMGKKGRGAKGTEVSAQAYDWNYLWGRTKDVFSLRKRPGTRNGPLFQKATAMKNFGAMSFFAFPWAVNQTVEMLTGVNPGFNIMLSFVPYTLYAARTFLKVRKIAYKDAFPMSVSTMENKFKETLAKVTDELAALPPSALQEGADELLAAAKLLHSDIKALATVEIRQNKGSFGDWVLKHEQEAVTALRERLVSQHGLTPAQAESDAQALQKVFDSLEHRDVKLSSVIKTPLLKGSLAAMALATVHELSVSSGFSFAMKGLPVPQGRQDLVFAITGLSMYGFMYLGRSLGNWLSRYISPATMYGFSSLTSIAGTAMMANANAAGDMGGLIAGSLVASFGVGNFFAAMYEHMVNLAPKYQREISLLITYTMPIAAIMSMPMRWLVDVTGMPSIDLWLSEAAVGGSLLLTTAMLRNSTLVQVAKHETSRLWKRIKGVFKRGGNNNPGDLNGAAPAN